MAEEPFVPDFLRDAAHVMTWEIENPRVVDAAVAEGIYARIEPLVRDLIARP